MQALVADQRGSSEQEIGEYSSMVNNSDDKDESDGENQRERQYSVSFTDKYFEQHLLKDD